MKVMLAEYSVCTGMGEEIRMEGAAMSGTLKKCFERADCSVFVPRDFGDDFLNTARACDCGLVIAPDDILADCTARLESACINLGSPSSTIRLCADKLETTELLLHNGLYAPRIIRESAHDGVVKCVVKPRTGCGSEDVFVSEGPVERDGFISTEYIEGEHLSVSLISGSGFVLPLTLNRQHIHMNGSVSYDGNDVNIDHQAKDEIFSVARKAGIMLGCKGLFGVDIVYADRSYVVDVNPRPTTAMVGVARVIDRNLADLVLLARFGELPDHVGYRGRCSFTKKDLGAFLSLGIDIGGANTKAATSDGRYAETVYLPLWRNADLKGTLERIKRNAPDAGAVGVTITGELADCYPTKKDGIDSIARIVKSVFPAALFYGCDGRFYADTGDHRLFSAANWSASARYIGRIHGDVLFVDIGSTTTDIIPVLGGVPVAGVTDFERLARSELVYAGVLRTNLAALLHTVEAKGFTVRTASELFAITADAYLLLGRITPEDYSCDTPDRCGRDPESAARRIARLVCCDMSELGMEDVRGIATQVYTRQVEDLSDAIRIVSGRHGLKRAAICGMGAFLARDALFGLEMPCAQVSDERKSKVFPAYAVANLLEDSENVS